MWPVGRQSPQGGWVFPETSHARKDFCWLWCTCAGSARSSFLGTYPVGFFQMKMKTVLETRTKEDRGIPPLQKSLLDTTPHLQGSLPYWKSLCWQSSVCGTPLTTWPSPLWYAGKCLTPDEKGGAPVGCTCQFLWYKYSYYGWFQVTKVMWTCSQYF